MNIGVLKEPDFDKRVSTLPEGIKGLKDLGNHVWVEKNAGVHVFCSDEDFQNAGAEVKPRNEILNADILLCINPPDETIQNKVLLGVFDPLNNTSKMQEWANSGNTVFSLDNLPRTTRAQAMDVLSSQANIAGYKAVLQAANEYISYFPMFMTAAGSIRPAKVLILGAGVAGLQAIATARRLGAVVEVFDTRPVVKEEVQSLGAKFIEVEGAADASQAGGYAVEQSEDYKKRQQNKIEEHAVKADIIITTARIPGRKAPLLIGDNVLEKMKPGSVIVDLASDSGGNCSQSKDNEKIIYKGIQIIGNANLASTMPGDASKMYGKNILNFMKLLFDTEGNFHLPFDDELVEGACISREGKITNQRILSFLNQ